VLPVKTFTVAKSRLSGGLSSDERQVLAQAMFRDVLLALARTKSVERVLVVTPDDSARRIAREHGADVIIDEQLGHNQAARKGVEEAVRAGAARALLVPGDCPALDPGEVDELLSRPVPEPSALIVPDRHGTGTNALVLTPPTALEPSFGPDSCRRHLEHARRSGLHGEVAHVATLALDVDTGEDLRALDRALAQLEGHAVTTRATLAQLGRSRVP
jgi:2-phospho-L-lactate guanylyltransferase